MLAAPSTRHPHVLRGSMLRRRRMHGLPWRRRLAAIVLLPLPRHLPAPGRLLLSPLPTLRPWRRVLRGAYTLRGHGLLGRRVARGWGRLRGWRTMRRGSILHASTHVCAARGL